MGSKRKQPTEFSETKWVEVQRGSSKDRDCDYDYDYDDDDGEEEEDPKEYTEEEEEAEDLKEYPEEEEEYPEEEEEYPEESYSDKQRLNEKECDSDTDSDEVKNPNHGYVRRFYPGVRRKIRRGEPEKPQRKKRLWNEEDEIWVLKGMLEFRDKKASDITANVVEFHDFIKLSLSIGVSVNQLRDKIKRLREKYRKNVRRTEHGEDPSFSNPHEETLFSLSKKIWGPNVDDEQARGENQEDRDQEDEEEDKGTIYWSLYPRLSESLQMDEFSSDSLPVSGVAYVKEMLSCIGGSKAEELEEKWRKLQVAETQVKLMRAQLIHEQTELILNSIK